jgi:arylsulfatase A-like enzyme
MINRRRLLQGIGIGAAGLSLPGVLAQTREDAKRPAAKVRADAPNIIFIMTDDQAQGALGIYGNRILKTPNMDRIGNEGIRFDEAFVTTSVCAPSRAFYDVEQDPDEMVNLIDAPEHAEHIARLKTRITELCAETGDVDPPGYVAPKLGPGKCPA